MRRMLHWGAALLMAGFIAGCTEPTERTDVYPRRPIKLIVPFAAGGGSDTFGRVLQNAIEQHRLLPERLVIINVPGAGGTIGSRRVKHARPDGYTLLLLHDGILTAHHSGSASYGPEAFAPIAGTGNATQVIAVGQNSPHADLPALMNEATRNPDSIVFSANIGAPSHYAGLMLEAQKPGARFRYTQTGGGAKRFAALQGGHVDVSAFSIAEYVQFKASGLRALALLGPERHPDLPELATATEQSFEVISQNMQFWWAPLGTPPERIQTIADALVAAMLTDDVREQLAKMKITDIAITGQTLETEIQECERRIAAVAPSANVELPNFAAFALGGLILTAAASLIQSIRRRKVSSDVQLDRIVREKGVRHLLPGTRKRCRTPFFRSVHRGCLTNGDFHRWQLAGIGVVTVCYVMCLQLRVVGFVPVTAVYAITTGGILVWPLIQLRRIKVAKAALMLMLVSLLMSVVMHRLFTEILVVDLP